MLENKLNRNIKSSEKREQIQLEKDLTPKGKENQENFNNIDIYEKVTQKGERTNEYSKKKNFKNTQEFNKTKSREIDIRQDNFGNIITHGGKQKIAFLDKITKGNFVEVIKIENYKEYNKLEESTPSSANGCCILI